ncbi:MAG: peptidylprolyl isomerase, partial [Deltaproteobacteria bacterium]
MLESIRKRSKSIYVFLILGAIIVVFIFWGVGPSDNDSAEQGIVATIDDIPITGREYSDLYRRQEDYYREVLKGPQAAEMLKRLDLKHKTLDILINRALAIKAAKKDGVKVEPKEVQEVITAIPAFSKDGAFNLDTYFQVLAANRLKPAEFEKAIEYDILAGKMQNLVTKDVAVAEEDILKEFRKERRKINLDFIAIDPARYAPSIKFDDAEVKAFFEKNSSGYIAPAKVRAAYAYAEFSAFSSMIKVTADEIKSYYERNPREFSQGKEGAAPQPIKDVEGAIRKTLTAQKARMQGLEAARALDAEFRKTGEPSALKKAATAAGFNFALAGPFSETDVNEELMRDENLKAAVFSLKPGDTSYPV